MYDTLTGLGWKKLPKTDDYCSKKALKPLLLVHLLWQMQFLLRKFVEEKTIYESRKNSPFMCRSDDDAFIL